MMPADGPVAPEQLQRQAEEDAASALAEDLGGGDLSAAVVGPEETGAAVVVCRESGVLCGRLWFEAVFLHLDGRMQFDWRLDEGRELSAGDEVVRLEGNLRALLGGERTALNFLQTLSGTATAARALCNALDLQRSGRKGPQLLDTRKTIPMLRLAQKHATEVGGMTNHRLGLWDAAMLKENHLAAAGGLAEAVRRVRREHPEAPLIVEITELAQVPEALQAGAEHILLDNFSAEDLRAAVEQIGGRARTEISGGLDAEHIPELIPAGADALSFGAVTKHLRALDFSMLLEAGARAGTEGESEKGG